MLCLVIAALFCWFVIAAYVWVCLHVCLLVCACFGWFVFVVDCWHSFALRACLCYLFCLDLRGFYVWCLLIVLICCLVICWFCIVSVDGGLFIIECLLLGVWFAFVWVSCFVGGWCLCICLVRMFVVALWFWFGGSVCGWVFVFIAYVRYLLWRDGLVWFRLYACWVALFWIVIKLKVLFGWF